MDMQKLAQLKSMAAKRSSIKDKEAPAEEQKKAEEAKAEEEEVEPPKTIEEFMERLNASVVSTRHFRTGKLDDYGRVVGLHEFPEGRVPHTHQTQFFDATGRVVKLEIYEKNFSKPITRVYFYEGDLDKISESVWFDRYGKLDNIHRYAYEPETGLMVLRAEYNREGEVFYQIESIYDKSFDPPRHVEDIWRDKKGSQIKRYEYGYDEEGEVITEEKYDEENKFIGYHKFTYDEKRVNLAKKEWFGRDRKLKSYFVYENNDQNYTTKVTVFDDKDNKESSQEFIYDDVCNVVEEKWYDAAGNMFKNVKY